MRPGGGIDTIEAETSGVRFAIVAGYLAFGQLLLVDGGQDGRSCPPSTRLRGTEYLWPLQRVRVGMPRLVGMCRFCGCKKRRRKKRLLV